MLQGSASDGKLSPAPAYKVPTDGALNVSPDVNLTRTSSIGLHLTPISIVDGSPGLLAVGLGPTNPPEVNSELLAEIVISNS